MIKFVFEKMQNMWTWVQQFAWVKDAIRIGTIMYKTFGAPVVAVLRPPVMMIFRMYKRAFVKMAFVDGKLSHQRAAVLAVPVLAVSTWFTVTVGIPETYDFAVDGIGVLTERKEHVFLTGAGPTPGDPTESIFQAKGCFELPCTEDNSTYYHIRPNSVKTMINLFTKGTIYLPDEVEAAIPDQLSECDVTIEWFRWRMFKIYNTLTEVSCLPVAQGK